MLAAKNFDPVLGIDIHIIQPPGPVPPLPIPHPFIGMVIDPFDFLPIVGGTVLVNGIPRATAGSAGKNIPPHIPIGGMFVKPIGNECEVFMGSSTVTADSEPFSYMALPVLSCHCIGMPTPPRNKKKSKSPGLFLPTSVVLPIPMGLPVFVGGPPTISFMAMGMKLAMGGLKKLAKLKKVAKVIKKGSDKVHKVANKVMKKLNVPPSVKNKVHKAICSVTGHPVDIATGKVFTDNVDFEIGGPILLQWEKTWYSTSQYNGPLGHGWHHSYDMALSYDDGREVIGIRLEDGRTATFPFLEIGEEYFNRNERLILKRDAKGFFLQNSTQLTFRFTKITFDEDVHLLESITDNNGFQIVFEYNALGHLQTIIDSADRVLKVENDAKGRITKIFAPHPDRVNERFCIVQYEYDKRGDLVICKDALEQAMTYQYNEHHLLIQETNRNGLSFYFEYDGTDHDARCLRTWGDEGIYNHKLTYLEGLTIVENSLGHKTQHFHDGSGLVQKVINAKGHVSTTKYSPFNEVLVETDEIGFSTLYEYDEWGNRTKIIEKDGAVTQIQYDGFLPISVTNPIGATWSRQYDEQSNVIEETDALGNKTTYAYEGGFLSEMVNPMGNKTRVYHDPQNKQINQLIAPNGNASLWMYDRLGRIVEVIDANGNAEQVCYNLLDQIKKIKEADGNIRYLKYDGEGNVIEAKDKLRKVNFGYGGFNKLVARKEAGVQVQFHYNTEEELIQITNEKGNTYQFELDELGKVVVETGFDGLKRHYVRDELSRVEKVLRPNNLMTQYEYDIVGRITGIKHSDGGKEEFSYRADGVLAEAANDSISVSFERDIVGKILREQQGEHTVENEYDLLGRRKEVRSSLGAHIVFNRNLMGDVEQVQANGGEREWEADFKHDKMGLEIERLLPGAVSSQWKRDRLGRPIEQATSVGGRAMRKRSYTWEVNHRLKQIKDSKNGTTTFGHDVFGNLSWAKYGNGQTEYRMPDVVGNLFKTKDRTDRKYGAAGQLLEANGTHYQYDAEGNLIEKKTAKGEVWRYEWNGAGMLKRVIRPDEEIVEFEYDALGRRITKTYRQKNTHWVWDGNKPLHEWQTLEEESSSVASEIPNIPSIPEKTLSAEELLKINTANQKTASITSILPEKVTTWVFEAKSFAPIARIDEDQSYSIVTDHLGTPLSMLNEKGGQVWSGDLSIYGQMTNFEGAKTFCPFRYQGQYEDAETGLYYNRFRYYDAESGEYVSQDPIGLWGGIKLYSYVYDPNKLIDWFGLAELVYQLLDENDNVVYYGITSRDAAARLAEHEANPDKVFTRMEVLAEDLTHDQARDIEGALIRERLDDMVDEYDATDSIEDKLKKSGLQNKNRGRKRARWKSKNPLKKLKPKMHKKPRKICK